MDTKKLTAFVAFLTLIVIGQTGYLVYLQTKDTSPSDGNEKQILPGSVNVPLGASRSIGISTESKLSKDNLNTQVKTVNGKKELINRRLLINNLKTEKVSGLGDFVTAYTKVEKYVTDQDIVMDQNDRNAIVEMYKREKIDVPLCEYYKDGKSSLKEDGLKLALSGSCR